VEGVPAWREERGVGDFLGEAVAEAVGRLLAIRSKQEEVEPDQIVEGLGERGRTAGPVPDRLEEAGGKRRPQDGRRVEQFLRLAREPIDAGEEDPLDGFRGLELRAPLALLEHGNRQLLDKERVPAAP